MPIRAENKARYPKDWAAIRLRIQTRARDKCERCGVPNHAWGFRENGEFNRVNKRHMIDMLKAPGEWLRPPFDFGPHRIIEIVCTTAHIDHVVENCSDENLLFLCQRCHLTHDAEHHAQTRYSTRREGRAIDMFSSSQPSGGSP